MFRLLFELNRRMPNGTYGGVRGIINLYSIMKLTYEEKLRIYDLWKNQHYSPRRIAKQYNINGQVIRYMVNLMVSIFK